MRRIVPVLLINLLILAPITRVQAQDDITPLSLAVEWLASQQAEDGSFANDTSATAIAAVALASAGQPNAEAVAWVEESISTEGGSLSTDLLSIAIIAAAVHGEDLAEWGSGAGDALTGALRSERGANIGGLCSGLIAMGHMGTPLPPTAIGGLKALQNADGGFGLSAGEASDIVSSAVCIHPLQLAEEIEARDAAIDFIASQQLTDGGWNAFGADTADSLTTGFVLVALNAAGEDLADWESASAALESFQDRETGMVSGGIDGPDGEFLNIAATGLAILVWGGHSLNPSEMMTDETSPDDVEAEAVAGGDFPEGPAMDANWVVIGEGFEMEELDTADDFFVTVIDPFTDDELYGIEIINWTAEYQYTGFIVEQFLPGEVLIYMAEQDPSVWENISLATLQMLPAEELAKLPADVQARAAE